MDIKQNIVKLILLVAVISHSACEKFLEIDPPKSSLVQETIFKSEGTATAALTGIYRNMALTSNSYASGGFNSLTSLAGSSADEFIGSYNVTIREFYENQISPKNSYLTGSLYNDPYLSIYTANAIIEGLSDASNITPTVKAQLEGEAHFIRAFAYFYLVNLFGAVPLQLTTDYRITRNLSKNSVSEVYSQIIGDLKKAEELLKDNYITVERVRPNKAAVQAMLARTYLYLKDWENAEKYASLVIEKTGVYSLVGLDDIFLKNSKEAIWQLFPTASNNSGDGNLFILVATPIYVSLRKDFVDNAFDAGDKRRTSWVQNYTNSTGTYFYPSKYKIRSSTNVVEYSMVLRLAEQYLIRAESRINRDNIISGVEDLNLIRQRPLNGVNSNPVGAISTSLNKSDALLAVEKERRVELFSEWGHRWLDLKRTGRVNSILAPLKTNWHPTDVLYPIPNLEISLNPLIKQNDGY